VRGLKMNFLEIIRELLLGLCIAILIPITTYWGVNVLFDNPGYQYVSEGAENAEAKKQHEEDWKKTRNLFQKAMFIGALIVGSMSIVAGTMISINSLSMGLIGGGIINICMALCFNPYKALLNFCIFLSLLIILIFLIVRNKNMHKVFKV
jgi:hypothetical protein